MVELNSESITEDETQNEGFLFIVVVSRVNKIFSLLMEFSGKELTEKCVNSSEPFDISQTDKTRIKLILQVFMDI